MSKPRTSRVGLGTGRRQWSRVAWPTSPAWETSWPLRMLGAASAGVHVAAFPQCTVMASTGC